MIGSHAGKDGDLEFKWGSDSAWGKYFRPICLVIRRLINGVTGRGRGRRGGDYAYRAAATLFRRFLASSRLAFGPLLRSDSISVRGPVSRHFWVNVCELHFAALSSFLRHSLPTLQSDLLRWAARVVHKSN